MVKRHSWRQNKKAKTDRDLKMMMKRSFLRLLDTLLEDTITIAHTVHTFLSPNNANGR